MHTDTGMNSEHVSDFSGRYRLSSIAVNGARAALAYPDLELMEDGSYRFGSFSGHWHRDPQGLALGEKYTAWGLADADGQHLTFRFGTEDRRIEISYARVAALHGH
jgi:hypothetical protein